METKGNEEIFNYSAPWEKANEVNQELSRLLGLLKEVEADLGGCMEKRAAILAYYNLTRDPVPENEWQDLESRRKKLELEKEKLISNIQEKQVVIQEYLQIHQGQREAFDNMDIFDPNPPKN